MKKHLSTIILLIVLLVGISVLLYPTVSNYVNDKHQSRAIARYDEALKQISGRDLESVFNEAEIYNAGLRAQPLAFFQPEKVPGYQNALNTGGSGIMGYITIDKINVELPIYHGTDADILQIAVGHMEGTSLPIGGKGNHCVLSAHCGLPGAKLFTQLDRLEPGDTFVITVLNRKLTYEVDDVRVVLPEQTDALRCVAGKDYCTLMTCTPYGINSHRLLVRGVRTDNAPTLKRIYISNEAYQIDKKIVTPLMCVPFVGILLLYLTVDDIVKTRKKKKLRRLKEFEDKENNI